MNLPQKKIDIVRFRWYDEDKESIFRIDHTFSVYFQKELLPLKKESAAETGAASKKRSIGDFLRILIVFVIVAVVLIILFVFLIQRVNSIVQRSRELSQHEIETISDQTKSLVSGYKTLSDVISANSLVTTFASYNDRTDRAVITRDAYDLQKLLASQVTLYGEHINFLALYFPEVEMVITQSRYLTAEETSEFFINYPEIPSDSLSLMKNGISWTPSTAKSQKDLILNKCISGNGSPFYVFLEFNLIPFFSTFISSGEDILIFFGNASDCYSATRMVSREDYRGLLIGSRLNGLFTLDDVEYQSVTVPCSLTNSFVTVGISTVFAKKITSDSILLLVLTALIVIISLILIIHFVSRRVLRPLHQLTQSSGRPYLSSDTDIGQMINSVTTELSVLKQTNSQLQRNNLQLNSWALGNTMNRLHNFPENRQNLSSLEFCLNMADIYPQQGYAMWAQSYPSKNTADSAADAPSDQELYEDLSIILSNQLFQRFTGIRATILKDWHVIIVACKSQDLPELETIREGIHTSFTESTGCSLFQTPIHYSTGTASLEETVSDLYADISYLNVWGPFCPEDSDIISDADFVNYCNLVRKLENTIISSDLSNAHDAINDIFMHAIPTGKENATTAQIRTYTTAIIMMMALQQKLPEEWNFIRSLDFEQRYNESRYIIDKETVLHDFIDQIAAHSAGNSQKDDQSYMKRVQTYIQEHLTDPDLNVTSIAEQFGTSVSALSHAFKDSFGINILEYIQTLRIAKAKELLLTENVRTVAQAVGFWDAQALTRAFKKLEGVSPAEYRKQARQAMNE